MRQGRPAAACGSECSAAALGAQPSPGEPLRTWPKQQGAVPAALQRWAACLLPGAQTAMVKPVFRFAPSPNGELHLGHALSALMGFERARAADGRFLLRIEDIDTARSRPE